MSEETQEETQEDRWERLGGGIYKFNFDKLVQNRRSNRPDLHALLLLESIFPGRDGDIIGHAEHDQIWLDFDEDDSEKLTDEQIVELSACGVFYDEDSLSMFR